MKERSDEFLDIFVSRMKAAMKAHDDQKGCTWKNMSSEELIDNFFEKIEAFKASNDPDQFLVAIANYSYFLWFKQKNF